jgi:lipopolysaccharide/colanic/teichoic acid biosynthesis glycosyltransferase
VSGVTGVSPWARRPLARLAKRAFDVVGASIGLAVTAPLMAGIALAVRRDVGSPVLFRQRRPGLGGAPFELIKFRTMRPPPSGLTDTAAVATDGDRLTSLGRTLRSLSLDELPTLWNVLRGDMSLVGPRPLLTEYLALHDAAQWRRYDMPPGITGWAQCNGRNAVPWQEKFEFDLWYVDHWSLRLDLRILLKTVVAVLRREGISAPGVATMPVFRGASGSDRVIN